MYQVEEIKILIQLQKEWVLNSSGGKKMINIDKDKFYELKKSGISFPVILERDGDEVTPITIFNSLEGDRKCLLESATGGSGMGRYSIIGIEPYIEIKSNDDKITSINRDENKEIEYENCDVLKVVKQFLNVKYDDLNNKMPFVGGAIGYAGYDVIRQYEKLPDNNEKEIDVPEAYLMFYKITIIHDHYRHKIYYVYNVAKNSSLYEKLEYENIETKLREISEKVKNYDKKTFIKESDVNKKETSNFTEEEFCEMVEKAKEYIRKGDIFQVVLSQRFTIETKSEPFDVYRRLRSANPSPYLFYIEFDNFHIVGSSPESLVSVIDGTVTTNPIAGTRPRGKTEEEDNQLEKELLKDEKELAEHTMLVDLGRNDIGKISEFGSVKLDKFMEIEKYSHVMHIVSKVSGKLKQGFDCFEALKSCLPAGTVSGAPKIRAMEIIDELENVKRGIYAGALGYFSYTGNMDVCIAIRTLVFKDGKAYVQAGGGLVYDSVPKTEYQESLNKSKALREVI
jgi:anthranilate synthase component 1